MKKIVNAKIISTAIFLLIQISFLNAQIIPNASFENWEIISGIEEPSYWKTNNVSDGISVTRDTGENMIEYAIKITGNAPGFEGPYPGNAEIDLKFQADYVFYGIKVHYKYESVPGLEIGEGGISIRPWIDGNYDFQNISGWSDFDAVADGVWTEESVYFQQPLYTNEYDSIRVSLFAGGINSGVGFEGNLELYIDSLEFITEDLTGVSSQEIEEKITISPNPFEDFLEINSEDYLIEKVFLHDIYGRVVFANSQTDRLDLGFLDQGVYYLYIKLKDGRTHVKLIQKI